MSNVQRKVWLSLPRTLCSEVSLRTEKVSRLLERIRRPQLQVNTTGVTQMNFTVVDRDVTRSIPSAIAKSQNGSVSKWPFGIVKFWTFVKGSVSSVM